MSELDGPAPLIVLDGAGMTYPGPPPVRALRPASLTIEAGEYVAIVGPSGSGKSTLLNIVGLLDTPTEGRYLLAGQDTSVMSERDRTGFRAATIGFVFQSFHLMPNRTAVENVAVSLVYHGVPRRHRLTAARDRLAEVDLAHRADALPSTLSGGERQRVAIARALATGPRLLLCDEPTGNLDSATTDSVLATIETLHATGLTILMITHDDDVASRAGRIITIRDGMVS